MFLYINCYCILISINVLLIIAVAIYFNEMLGYFLNYSSQYNYNYLPSNQTLVFPIGVEIIRTRPGRCGPCTRIHTAFDVSRVVTCRRMSCVAGPIEVIGFVLSQATLFVVSGVLLHVA